MSRVTGWQGTLRSQTFEQKDSMVNKKTTRSALGDISNRTRNNNASGTGWKKTGSSKPFAVAVTKEKTNEKKSEPTRQFQNSREPIDDIDMADLKNPKYCAEYVSDIYKFHRSMEARSVASPEYMSKQNDINPKMRALLIDWLSQVHTTFELIPATMYLTVNLLDRFLEKQVVSRRKLQLVGSACMLLASKYEEIYAPELSDFVAMSDKAFNSEDLLKMEGVILNVLKFSLTVPTAYKFLRRYLKVQGASVKIQHHATYIIERSLQEYRMLKFLPSKIAASALLLANQAEEHGEEWDDVLERISQYKEEDLWECCDELTEVIADGESSYLQAVRKKYSSSKYMCVSSIQL